MPSPFALIRWLIGALLLGYTGISSASFQPNMVPCYEEQCLNWTVEYPNYPTLWGTSPESGCATFAQWLGGASTRVTRPGDNPQMRCYWSKLGQAEQWAPMYAHAVPRISYRVCPAFSFLAGEFCSCKSGYLEDVNARMCHEPNASQLAMLRESGPPPDRNCTNPINGSTGNKYQSELDYGGPLRFERHYNANFAHSRMLGRGWRHTYDRELNASGTGVGATALLIRADGRAYKFTRATNGWIPPTDVNDRLVDTVVGGKIQWQFTVGDDNSTEIYDDLGRLTAIIYPDARRLALDYDSMGRLQYLTDQLAGRRLSFEHPPDGQTLLVRVADPAGNEIRYTYSGARFKEQLVEVLYQAATTQRFYRYNESPHTSGANLPDALTGIVDENGERYASYGYDATGRGVSSEHAGGADRYELAYNPDGTTTVTDPLGAARTYSYTNVQGIKRQTGQSQPAGAGCPASASARTYDANGNIATSTDFNGSVTTNTWDLTRNLLTQTVEASGTPEARTTSTEWHAFWRLPTRVAEPKRRITYRYNGDIHQGNAISCAPPAASIPAGTGTRPAPLLCSETHEATTDTSGATGFSAAVTGQPRTWAYTYDASGQILTENGPRTDVSDLTTYTYHASANADHAVGDLQSITNAQGHTTHFDRYDGNGRLLQARDTNGVVLSYSWHPRGWLLSSTVDGLTTVYERDAVGQVLSVTTPQGKLNYIYDAARRLVTVSDMAGRAVAYTRDAKGNVLQTEWVDPGDVLALSMANGFDVLGREQSRTEWHNGVARTTQYGYDANGNRRLTTDPKNQSTTLQFDALNRQRQTIDALFGTTQLSYDARDQLTQFQAPNGATTSFTVNGLGNVTQEASANSGTTNLTYDAAGNVLTSTDARGITQTRTYDALNRLLSVSYPTPGENITYTWDSAPGCTYGVGRLCAVTDAAGSSRFAYDSRGHLLSHTRTEAGFEYVTAYTRDEDGRVTELTYPTGQVVNFIRDSDGVIEQITTDAEDIPGLKVVDQVQVNAAGQTTRLLMGNGVSLQRTYAEDGRLLSQSATPALMDLSLGYDANGNVATRTMPDFNASYGYDALDRLSSEASPAWTSSIGYDANGNRISDGTGPKTYTPNSDRLSTINGQSVTMDAAGNTLQSGTTVYTWNQAGQLKTVSRGNLLVATYFYDYRGLRTRRITTAEAQEGITNTVYHYDEDGRVIAETWAQFPSPKRSYVWRDDVPQAIVIHAWEFAHRSPWSYHQVLYLETDHLGSPIAARNQNGVKVWHWRGDAFGSYTPDEDPDNDLEYTRINLRFPGQYASDGLIYNWHRYYDPTMGRYISADPIGIAGGSNGYGYARQNPQRYTDLNGLTAGAVPGAVAGSAFGPVGTVVGGLIGAGASAWLGWNVFGPMFQRDKTPNTGEPGSWHLNPGDGKPGSGQERLYGPSGKPEVDIDWHPDHGAGKPHGHNWDQNGRGPAVPLSPWPRGRTINTCPAR
jgi:RHS repeat-associated protein